MIVNTQIYKNIKEIRYNNEFQIYTIYYTRIAGEQRKEIRTRVANDDKNTCWFKMYPKLHL